MAVSATLAEAISKLAHRAGHASDAGLTAVLTGWQVERIVIAGSPGSGEYTVTYTAPDGTPQESAALAHNASGAALQAALRALTGLEAVTVATSGTTPNFSHDISLVGVPGAQRPLTSAETFDQGTLTHSTPTEGTASLAAAYQTILAQVAVLYSGNERMQDVTALRALDRLLLLAEELASEFV